MGEVPLYYYCHDNYGDICIFPLCQIARGQMERVIYGNMPIWGLWPPHQGATRNNFGIRNRSVYPFTIRLRFSKQDTKLMARKVLDLIRTGIYDKYSSVTKFTTQRLYQLLL